MMKPTFAALSLATLLSSCTPPCPDLRRIRDTIEVPRLEDLTAWLSQKESLVPHLKTGVDAQIIWAHPQAPSQTPLSIIYLPGYTATREEISPVPERVAAALGANLFYARLTAQGQGPEAHKDVTAKQWIRDAIEALLIGRRIGQKVVVMGTSTGGTLAAILALNPGGLTPDASVLISPNLTPADPRSEWLLWPMAGLIVHAMLGKEIDIEPRNPAHGHFWDLKHDPHSLIPMMRLVQWARRGDFEQWPTPALVLYDPLDTVVNEQVTVQLFGKSPRSIVQCREWEAAPGDDHHVLAGDILSPGGTESMIRLVKSYLEGVFGVS